VIKIESRKKLNAVKPLGGAKETFLIIDLPLAEFVCLIIIQATEAFSYKKNMKNRLWWVALLPLLILAYYLVGHKNQTAENIPVTEGKKGQLPEQVGTLGLKKTQHFDRSNLWQWVESQSDYYISMGFKHLVVAEYVSQMEPDVSLVTLEIFTFDKALNAFGVLSDEGEGGEAIELGQVGWKKGDLILFYQGGRYYRLSVGGELSTAIKMGKLLLELDPAPPLEEFEGFVGTEGLKASWYQKNGFKGLDWVGPVVFREYENGEFVFQIARFLDPGPAALKLYLEHLTLVKKTTTGGGFSYKGHDLNNSPIELILTKKGLYGVYGDAPPDLIQNLLNKNGI